MFRKIIDDMIADSFFGIERSDGYRPPGGLAGSAYSAVFSDYFVSSDRRSGGNEVPDEGAKKGRHVNDHKKPATKDATILKIIPDKVTECSLGAADENGVCVDSKTIGKIAKAVDSAGKKSAEVMADAKEKTGCPTQKCVVKTLAGDLHGAAAIIKTRFKIDGPTDTALADNVSIDSSLETFAARFRDFYAYNFNMLDYADNSFRNGRVVAKPDTLATVNMAELYKKGYRTAGCVINSDVYHGKGKHWMALFVDMRRPVLTVEFFNSSGNSPHPTWVNWLVKTRNSLMTLSPTVAGVDDVVIERVTNIRHQQSKTECGIYALFYIYARLCGVGIEYFRKTPIKDQLMFEFRQHLFTGEKAIDADGRFDYETYRREVSVKWEDE